MSYLGRLEHLLQTASVLEKLSSIHDLHTLANSSVTPVENNSSKETALLASPLKNYCLDEASPVKAAELVSIVCQLQRYSLLKHDWRLLEGMILRLSKTDISGAVDLAQGISAIAREVEGHNESQRILDQVRGFTQKTSPRQHYSHLASMANNAKDGGKFEEAEKLYQEALKIGKQNNLPLAPVLFQIGRLELELGRDINSAIQNFDSALEHGFERFGAKEPWEIRVNISKIQALFAKNNIPGALSTYTTSLNLLPQDQRFLPAESGLHHSLIGLSSMVSNHLASEWLSRMNAIGHILSGVNRERDGAITEVGRAMTNIGFPSDVNILFQYAKKDVDENDLGLSRPSILLNIANAHRLKGDYDLAIEYFKQSLYESEKAQEVDSQLSALCQLALSERLNNDKAYFSTTSKIECFLNTHEEIKKHSIGIQVGMLDAISLLEQYPKSLGLWPEELRRSRLYLTGELSPLQNALNRRVTLMPLSEQKMLAAGGVISIAEMKVRGAQAGYIMNDGYLSTIRSLLGLRPQEVLEWVFKDLTAIDIQKRIFLESLVDISGNRFDQRYVTRFETRGWVKVLPEIRGIMARWLYDTLKNADSVDLNKMEAFYSIWRKHDISLDIMDIERNRDRVRNPEEGFTVDDATEEFTKYTKELIESLSKNKDSKLTEEEIIKKAINMATSELSLKTNKKFFDSKKMGLHENNYLDFEMFDVLNEKQKGESIYVLDLYQSQDEAIWTFAKLSESFDSTMVSSKRVNYSKKQAGEMVFTLQEHIHREQSGLINNPHVFNLYRSMVYSELKKLTQPLEKLMSLAPKDASIFLRFASPWNAIPIEQLPAFNNDLGLIDYYRVSRLDSFGNWMRSPVNETKVIKASNEVVAIGYEGTNESKLPIELHHKTMKALFNTKTYSGNEATCHKFYKKMPQSKILDFFGHGELIDGLGAKEIFIAQLTDGGLLAQEIVAKKEIKSCHLFVLNSCRLAMNQTDRDKVTSAIPNFADHLISGGVDSVVAALHVLNAQSTVSIMSTFYQELASNNSLSISARSAWGMEARIKENKLLIPMALFGADQKFSFEN